MILNSQRFWRNVLLSLVFVILLSEYAMTQTKDLALIDSLSPIVSIHHLDTTNIRHLCMLSAALSSTDYNKGLSYGFCAHKLAQSIGHLSLEAAALESIGRNYWAKSQFSEAFRYHTQTLAIYTKMKNYRGMIRAYMSISSSAFAQNKFKDAEQFYISALALAKKEVNDPVLIAGDNGIMQCMAMTYMALGNISKAMLILDEADRLLLSKDLFSHRIGLFSLKGQVYFEQSKMDSAFTILKLGLQMALHQKEWYWCGKIEDQFAHYKKNVAKYDESLQHSQQSIKYFTKATIAGHVAKSRGDIGALILETLRNKRSLSISNPLREAIFQLEEALRLARPISHFTRLREYEENLSQAYIMKGDYPKAMASYRRFRDYNDSINNINREKDFVRQLLALEFEKSRDSLASQKRLDSIRLKNLDQANSLKQKHIQNLWIIFGAGILLLLIISSTVYLEKKSRIKQLSLILENEAIIKKTREAEWLNQINELAHSAIQSQLNPHFLFNCLNSIKLFIEENQKENASHFLTQFSLLMRKTLDTTKKESIPLHEEIVLASLYFEMESMRLKNKLTYEINCHADVDQLMTHVPPLLLQPLIENAIWHGLMPVPSGGNINIDIKNLPHDNGIEFQIKDNGIGFQKSFEQNKRIKHQHHSHGLNIIKERLQIFGKKTNKITNLDILDLTQFGESGTCIRIIITS